MNVTRTVLAYLVLHPGQAFTAFDAHTAAGCAEHRHIAGANATLYALHAAGAVERLGARGSYTWCVPDRCESIDAARAYLNKPLRGCGVPVGTKRVPRQASLAIAPLQLEEA